MTSSDAHHEDFMYVRAWTPMTQVHGTPVEKRWFGGEGNDTQGKRRGAAEAGSHRQERPRRGPGEASAGSDQTPQQDSQAKGTVGNGRPTETCVGVG
eukprot:1178556-Prorocentrum_minimum.AAC.3